MGNHYRKIDTAPRDRPILGFFPELGWMTTQFCIDSTVNADGWGIGFEYDGPGPTHWRDCLRDPTKLPEERVIPAEEAYSYDWWQNYLTARMEAIQSMLALDLPNDEIIRTISCDQDHVRRLLPRAVMLQMDKP